MSLTSAIKSNIRGDVWPGLPKRFQSFLFFRVQNKVDFKNRLKTFIPKITTESVKLEGLPGINIGFTSTGLEALGAFVNVAGSDHRKKDRQLSTVFRKQQLRGGLFEKGMYADLVGEGWDNPDELREQYKPTAKEVILDTKISEVKQHFLAEEGEPLNPDTYVLRKNPSIEFTLTREGKCSSRPDERKRTVITYQKPESLHGPELTFIFSFDSRMALASRYSRSWDEETTRWKRTQGHKARVDCLRVRGDHMGQPAWAKDGSFLVFRDLQQLVPEFDEFMEENAKNAPFAQDHDKPAEKLAAYLMGRWKNGTPVDESPHDDSNEESIHIEQLRLPPPDLEHDHAVIIRRGIPYGDEVSAQEMTNRKSAADKERGLLFACYQSDIRNGFNFLKLPVSTQILNSDMTFDKGASLTFDFFQAGRATTTSPDRKSNFVGDEGPGIDAFVGQRLDHHPPRSIGLPDGKYPTEARMPLDSWVVPKGRRLLLCAFYFNIGERAHRLWHL
ncbi:hypothetical protein N7516_005654 [Penicillium verrucosum]|uniref:uncharacterized protein n=1 Tax=Penicillium verrucosum TaxID=60171 RepID=UPI0025451287|nr:uncharacterized protein N7516_005654 [Penicillium verrucosum]KAJ5945486.1 hypothetical protein N7516_005654 [Penicillium verrucosum]